MSSLWQNPRVFIGFLFSISISGDSATYFSEMFLLISFAGTQTRTRMRHGRVIFPSKWSMTGSVCLYGKIPKFLCVKLSIIIFGGSASYFIQMVSYAY